MNAGLRKEIRLLWPAWIAAVVVSTLPMFVAGARSLNGDFQLSQRQVDSLSRFYDAAIASDIQTAAGWGLFFFGAGALLLSLASFGLEMSFGTFAPLLAQPRPRLETWSRKIGVLAVALASVAAIASLAWWFWMRATSWAFASITPGGPVYSVVLWQQCHAILLLALLAMAGGLWTTLLFRQLLTAFWFALLVPIVLSYFASPLSEGSIAIILCGYALAGLFLARWLFLRAQDKPEREAGEAMSLSFMPVLGARRRPWAALLVKELHLQQTTLAVAAVLLVVHLAAVEAAAARYLPPAWVSEDIGLKNIWMVWWAMPLLVGCGSVAEERRGRTLEGALCLPVSGSLQFVVKLLVVFGLGIFLGAVMPYLLEWLRPAANWPHAEIKHIGLRGLLLLAAILTCIGAYASSMTSSLLQAFGAALVMVVALFVITVRWAGESSFPLLWLFIIVVATYLSYANFKQWRITRRQLLRNGNIWLAAIVSCAILWLIVGGFFYLVIPR